MDTDFTRPTARRTAVALVAGAIALLSAIALTQPAHAAPLADARLAVVSDAGAPIAGVNLFVRQGSCAAPGTSVWGATTGASGAITVTLAPGAYCVQSNQVPAGYEWIGDVPFEVVAGSVAQVSISVPRTVGGRIIAKNIGQYLDGVEGLISRGACGSAGLNVWRGTTKGIGFNYQLAPGSYCATVTSVPAGFDIPAPAGFTVTRGGQNDTFFVVTGATPPPDPALRTATIRVVDDAGTALRGVAVWVRQGTCAEPGTPVWASTASVFSVTLTTGQYCIQRGPDMTPVAGYDWNADVPVTLGTNGQQISVVVPRTVNGAIVAKNAFSQGVAGVTALTTRGTCAAPGQGVWQNTTPVAGYGISLSPRVYCTTVISAPAGYAVPAPVETTVTRPGPVWITLWMPAAA